MPDAWGRRELAIAQYKRGLGNSAGTPMTEWWNATGPLAEPRFLAACVDRSEDER